MDLLFELLGQCGNSSAAREMPRDGRTFQEMHSIDSFSVPTELLAGGEESATTYDLMNDEIVLLQRLRDLGYL